MLAAFFRRTEAGGDFRMNVKLLSAKTVMITGRIIPFWSFVLALNSLQNAMMLTPCAPSAGPTGGAGLAAPAGSWRRMQPWIFFAIVRLDSAARGLVGGPLDLPVLELHRREPAEDRDGYLQLAPVRVDLVDPAVQVGKRAVVDLDLLADGVLHLRHLLAVGRLDPGADLVDLGLAQRRRVLAPDEADHAGDLPHEVPGLVDQLLILAEKAHLDEDVARIQLPDLGRLLAVLNLGDDFRRQQDLKDRVVQLLGRLEPLDVGLHLVLLAGERVKGEPLGSRGSGRLGGHGGFSG